MGKKSTPKPPDYTDLITGSKDIAAMNAQAAADQLAWAKEETAKNRALLEQVLGVQLPIMQQQYDNAQKDRQRYEEKFLPAEDALINEFQNYASPQRVAFERGRAIADVNTAFDAQRQNALQRLESFGIDPSQTRNQALDLGMRVAQAQAAAQAGTQSAINTENTGRALRADVINIGRGMPTQVAQSYGQSIAAGQAGVSGANQTTGTSAGALTSGTQFSNTALQGYNQAGSLLNQGFQNQMAIANYNQAGMGQWLDLAGSLGGAAVGAMMQEGGIVPEAGALPVAPVPGSTDRQPAMLTPGEAVIPRDVVNWKGQEFFAKLKAKSRESMMASAIADRRASPGAIPMGGAPPPAASRANMIAAGILGRGPAAGAIPMGARP